jgi:hypothetical protein
MRPVRTASSNMVFVGPPGVGDLHCQRLPSGAVRTIWRLTRAERDYVAATGHIELEIFAARIPPVAVNCTDEVGVGEDAPDVLDRLDTLRGSDR